MNRPGLRKGISKTERMQLSGDLLFIKINALVVRLVEDTLSPGERSELESLLVENPVARRLYVERMHEDACLRWLCAEDFADAVAPVLTLPDRPAARLDRRSMRIVSGGLLASIVALVIWAQFFNTPRNPANAGGSTIATTSPGGSSSADARSAQNREVVATITATNGVEWAGAAGRLLSRCAVGDRMRLQTGSAELTFDVGVQVTVFGPADFEIT